MKWAIPKPRGSDFRVVPESPSRDDKSDAVFGDFNGPLRDSGEEHVDTSSVDPIEVLKHLMEEHEMKSADLGKLIGSKGVASEILNGKRELSKAHIVKLAEHFSVDPSVFFPLPKR